ncbi:MAG: hypothetical protein H7210_05180 [Pyrinomonadaceae bacterium]|nr:hypothetical protein [Phycisphaerales bacterium]
MLATLCGSVILVSGSTAQFITPLLPGMWIGQPEKSPPTLPVVPPPAPGPAADAIVQPNQKKKPDAAAKEYTTVDELLAALETADKDLTTLTATMTFDNVAGEIEGGERQSRRGTVSFRNSKTLAAGAGNVDPKPVPPAVAPGAAPGGGDGPAAPKGAAVPADAAGPIATSSKSFAVTFDVRISGDNKMSREARTFIMHEGVLVEKLANDKHINRYKLGGGTDAAKIDPLKIGEGPFPIPFGQKPADITARFSVALLPGLTDVAAQEEPARKMFEETYQLRLIPKPGTKAAKEFSEARIWFAKKDLIPIMARTNKIGGGLDEFRLVNIQLNKPIDDAVFSTAVPEGWTLEEKEMR